MAFCKNISIPIDDKQDSHVHFNHFKRIVETKLNNWGYDYSRSGVTILRCPSLPEEKLKELLIRELGLDMTPYFSIGDACGQTSTKPVAIRT